MKLHFLFAVMAAMVLGLSANAGVSVGNGQTIYWSAAGFSIQYANTLSLHVVNPDDFVITNENLIGPTDTISKATFVVTKGGMKDVAELAKSLAAQDSSTLYQSIKMSGAQGYYNESHSAAGSIAHYYLVSVRGDLLEITLDAHVAGDGVELIAPIVRSLAYDTTPPVIDEVHLDHHLWAAETTQKVWIHATDDLSGIDTRVGTAMISSPTIPKKGAELLILSQRGLVDEGNGWYSISVAINKYQARGRYIVMDLKISDRAGNLTEISGNIFKPTKFYEIQTNLAVITIPTKVRIPNLRITNLGISDAKSPRLLRIRLDSNSWRAGQTKRMFFQATDVGSGIDVASIQCDGLSLQKDDNDFHATPCQNPRAEGKDWYSVELPISAWAQSGVYELSVLSFADRAGNVSEFEPYSDHDHYDWEEMQRVGVGAERSHKGMNLPVFRVNVINTGLVDLTPPEILEVKVDATTWQAGVTQRIRFRATDDLSGIKLGDYYNPPFSEAAEFLALPPAQSMIYMAEESKVVSDGGDWYHIDLPLGLLPEIEHLLLYSVGIQDNAGNWSFVECSDPRQPTDVVTCKNTQGRAFDPIYLKVIR